MIKLDFFENVSPYKVLAYLIGASVAIVALIYAAWKGGVTSLIASHVKQLYLTVGDASGQLLGLAMQTKPTDWAPLLTDVIAISAGLGALALPLSLSVIEATRSRYKSPTLLSIYTEISRTDPQKINRSLFSVLVFALLLKLVLLANMVSFVLIVPVLFGLVVFSCATAAELYRHLSFTYKLMSDIGSVSDLLMMSLEQSLPGNSDKGSRYKVKRFLGRRKKYQPLVTAALIEIETYEICSAASKRDVSDRIRSMLFYHLDKLEVNESVVFMQDVLEALPRMMSEVETSRELDVYQRISGLYLYLVSKAVMASSDFSCHLDEAERISRFREKSLPHYGQFCSNGRIFLDCILSKPGKEAYEQFFRHFSRLLRNALDNNPENIPQILSNANNLLFGSGYDDDNSYALPQKINALWGYEGNKYIAKDIKDCIDGKLELDELRFKLFGEHEAGILKYINREPDLAQVNIEEIKSSIGEVFEEILNGLVARQVAESMEVETLKILGLLLEKSPEVIIKCREFINPAGASSINIGRPLVPSSLNACVKALVHEKYYKNRFGPGELLEFKLVDAIGMLIVYELWKTFIFQDAPPTEATYLQQVDIPSCTIRELKGATDRIATLDKSFKKILRDKRVFEKLSLLDVNAERLSGICDSLCAELRERLLEATEKQIKSQRIDPGAIERFKLAMLSDWEGLTESLPLFKRLKVSNCESYKFTSQYPRYAFLEDTDTHFVFRGYGRRCLQYYHDHLVFKVLERNQLSVSAALPIPVGRLILLTYKALKDLENYGFKMRDRNLVWPDNANVRPLYIVRSEASLYYQVMRDECLLNVSYESSTEGYPITIQLEEKELIVEASLVFNFSLADE